MKQSIFEELGGTYLRAGDYLAPNLASDDGGNSSIGVWGWRHLQYLKECRPILYNSLELNGKLNSYLVEIDRQAREKLNTIIKQAALAQRITERLKADDPLAWVGKMNNIRCAAEEIVNREIIYA